MYSSSSSSPENSKSWISTTCTRSRNKFLCEVEKTYIEDSFNLFGLKQSFPYDFHAAMDVILDKTTTDSLNASVQSKAELLYGLVHARYILSGAGLVAMHKKFIRGDFGECPRTCCESQLALPVRFLFTLYFVALCFTWMVLDDVQAGLNDELGSSVKLFCPRCKDIFNPPLTEQIIDGAFFGTTFPHVFLLTFEEIIPTKPTTRYTPRIFGFKIHSSSNYFQKQQSLSLGSDGKDCRDDTSDDTDRSGHQPLLKKTRKS